MTQLVPRHLNNLHASIDREALTLRSTGKTLYPKAATVEEQAKIPDPSLFASLARPAGDNEGSDLPTVGECAVHLELLEAFRTLRLLVVGSSDLDTTFGVKIRKREVLRAAWNDQTRTYALAPAYLKDLTWETRRRKKWLYFLDVAAGRFRAWIAKMDAFLKESDAGVEEPTRLPFLPPIDILMVWHAFLLNPHDYDQACRRDNLTRVAALRFPWEDVHAAIDPGPRHWSYVLPKASAAWTRDHADMEPDLYHYLAAAGKTPNAIATALARYGSPDDAPPIALTIPLNTAGHGPREAAFLTLLHQAALDKAPNAPLVANVQRQTAFVDKMQAQLWLRSPAAEGTLRRAGERYAQFLRLFQLAPRQMLVPTLDIDLVWHTHQCSAGVYRASVERRAGVFLDHDDKIGKERLEGGMAGTSREFLRRFGEEYDRCCCWDCEAIMDALEENDGPGGQEEGMDVLAERVREKVRYYRCVEIFRWWVK